MTATLRHLRKRPEFLRVARTGLKSVTPGLVLQAGPRPAAPEEIQDAQQAREPVIGYGLTASRKVGNAVTRNRARRRLRALAEEILPGEGRPGFDYVMIARAETPSRPYMELIRDLKSALSHLEKAASKRRVARGRTQESRGRR